MKQHASFADFILEDTSQAQWTDETKAFSSRWSAPVNGRPAIEPELLFRMLVIGCLYGIKSEVKLAQAVNENIAFHPHLKFE